VSIQVRALQFFCSHKSLVLSFNAIELYGSQTPEYIHMKSLNKLIRFFAVLGSLLVITGCANTDFSKAPGTDLSQLETFFVVKLSADERGIERLISDRLNMMGYQSTYGVTPPEGVDAIVTYQDKWMWDITMYMLQLDVQVRDSKTSRILASGRSYRPSMQRKSPEGMVEEVLTQLMRQ
jgi:hypothetical protein